MKNLLIYAVVVVSSLAAFSTTEAGLMDVIQADLEYRREIRSMDITERPNRLIHVYGNTVRWRYHNGRSVLYGNR